MELTGALIWVERWSTAANLCGRMVLAGEGEKRAAEVFELDWRRRKGARDVAEMAIGA